jgi:hypothetical protein
MKNYKSTLILLTVLILLGIAYFFFQRGKTTIEGWEAEFATKDTANVVQVKLTAYRNNKSVMGVTLNRKDKNRWMVNNQYACDPEKINMLLSTMYSLQVSEPVHANARENIIRRLTLDHIRVEINKNDGTDKTYFVGEQPPIGNGSMMMMNGAQHPYFVELPGLQGYLKPYFSAYLNDWRDKTILDATPDNLKRLSVQYEGQDSSYVLIKKGTTFVLESGEPINPKKLQIFLKGLGKKAAQGFIDRELPRGLDSLSKLKPNIRITVEKINGEKSELVMYRRPQMPDSYFGWLTDKKELLVIQQFNMQSILIRRKDWLAEKAK